LEMVKGRRVMISSAGWYDVVRLVEDVLRPYQIWPQSIT
jgi:hypothetical protein